MGKNAVVLIGLLILGGILAVVVWFLVFLPFRIVQPIDFTPLYMSEDSSETLQQRIEEFTNGPSDSIDLSREDLGLLIKWGVEEQLGMDITALTVEFGDDYITTIINVEIGNIPSGGYLTWILTRQSVEYTTTFISAKVWPEVGAVAYDLLDFRIGKFKIPNMIVQRLVGEETRAIEGVYIQEMELHDDYIRITRR
jgi:hypothetical protein